MKRLSALFLLILFSSCLLTGCTININIDNSSEDTTNETDSKHIFDYIFNGGNSNITMYESRASIYIANTTATDAAISSSDLICFQSLVETYAAILKSTQIQGKIREEYPGIEFELTLEPINETLMFAITATGENPEKLEEICNMAVSLLCEKLPQIVENASCKVVAYAKSAQLVGTN